jgi:DNA-binding NarL/FixJ family response regulator
MEELEFEHSQLIPQRRARADYRQWQRQWAVPAQDGRESPEAPVESPPQDEAPAILGMSTKDIAAELEMSENAVRQCLNSS